MLQIKMFEGNLKYVEKSVNEFLSKNKFTELEVEIKPVSVTPYMVENTLVKREYVGIIQYSLYNGGV